MAVAARAQCCSACGKVRVSAVPEGEGFSLCAFCVVAESCARQSDGLAPTEPTTPIEPSSPRCHDGSMGALPVPGCSGSNGAGHSRVDKTARRAAALGITAPRGEFSCVIPAHDHRARLHWDQAHDRRVAGPLAVSVRGVHGWLRASRGVFVPSLWIPTPGEWRTCGALERAARFQCRLARPTARA